MMLCLGKIPNNALETTTNINRYQVFGDYKDDLNGIRIGEKGRAQEEINGITVKEFAKVLLTP